MEETDTELPKTVPKAFVGGVALCAVVCFYSCQIELVTGVMFVVDGTGDTCKLI